VSQAIAKLLGLALLGACTCPPLPRSYESPEETLVSWQSHLCRDDPAGEYACLSADLKRSMAGFETYHAARARLLEEEPLFAWLLERVDLPERATEFELGDGGLSAAMTFDQGGATYVIRFVVEAWATLELADGELLVGRLDRPVAALLGARSGREWIDPPRPRLDPEVLPAVRAVHIESRWKIDAIDGLSPALQVTP